VIALIVAVCLSLCSTNERAGAAGAPSATSAPKLTREGSLRVNLERLLRQAFGNRQPFVSGMSDFSCAGQRCEPLGTYSPFFYYFAPSTKKSEFREGGRDNTSIIYGNYAQPILLKGHTILCSQGSGEVLVLLVDSTSYDLQCVKGVGTQSTDPEIPKASG
jgi:hypothetical protein